MVWAYSSRTATSSSGRLTLSFILRCYPGITRDLKANRNETSFLIGYLTKYLAKSMSAPMGEGQQSGSPAAAHHDRLAAQVRWLPCTPGCGNWLRYGIQPKGLLAVC